MVKIFAIAAAAVAFVGQAAADPVVGPTCTPGQIYCGFRLLDDVSGPFWRSRIDPALINSGRAFDSTFRCVTPTSVVQVQWCKDPATPGLLCQPNESRKCQGPVDNCCAA